MTDTKLTEALKKISQDGGKAFLITNEGCPGCDAAKEMLKTDIEQKLITVSDIQESDDAVVMAATLDIVAVPQIVAKFKDKVCAIDEETGKVTKCEITKQSD